jgi:hypothetical protein
LNAFGSTQLSLAKIHLRDSFDGRESFERRWLEREAIHRAAVNHARENIVSRLRAPLQRENESTMMLRLLLFSPWIDLPVLYSFLKGNELNNIGVLVQAFVRGGSVEPASTAISTKV